MAGQAVTFTDSVTQAAPGGGAATGTVTFKDGTLLLATGTLSGGVASSEGGVECGRPQHHGGVRRRRELLTGGSAALTETVNQADTTSVLSASANTAVAGQAVAFTDAVSAASPGGGAATGTVTFKDGSQVSTER